MKYLLLSILLIASISLISIPEGFGAVEKGINFDRKILSINPDGSQNIKSSFLTYDRILDNGIYKDYIFTETAWNLKITTSNGFVSLDKNSCGFNFDDKFTDSIIAFNSIVDLYSWNDVTSVNKATCEAYFDLGNNSLVAKKYASGVGFMEYKYIFNNGLWKTQLEATNLTNLTNRVFAFDQTIDLNRDIIHYGGNNKNLDNYSGQTFSRAWIESNESKIIDFMNGVRFDFDLGLEYLDSISITDTGANKSKLTFHYMRNNNILMPNETLIIDPTFVSGAGVADNVRSGAPSATTACPTVGSTFLGGDQLYLEPSGSTANYCSVSVYYFDVTAVDNDISVVTSATWDNSLATIGNVRNCDITAVLVDPTTATADEVYKDIRNDPSGNVWLDNDAWCTTTGAHAVILNSQANTDIASIIGGGTDQISLGVIYDDMVRDGNYHEMASITSNVLTLEYSTTPPIPTPDSITDLTLDSKTQYTAIVSFTPPNLRTGNLTTYTFNLDTPQNNNVQTFFANSTNNPFTFTGLNLGTSYSANATAITEGGGNYTLANVLNFTTNTWINPGAPTLSASALSDTAIRYTSVLGSAGSNSTIWYGLQCDLNSAGYTSIVSNSSYVSFYEYTGLVLGDVNICQWRDGSVDGWSNWSNTATDTLTLSILSAQRGTTDPDDHLMAFINMVSGFGGVYFGLGVVPFGIMLIGFMAGKKTVRIFTLATLMLMGIVHASGYYVFPAWYWTLCLLFGLVLIMGRMKSD